MAIPVTLFGQEFPSVKAAKDIVQGLVQACPHGGITRDADTVLRALIDETEPQSQRFILTVSQRMHVNVHQSGREPWRFGWNSAIKAKSHKQRVTLIARELIAPQRPTSRAGITECSICDGAFEMLAGVPMGDLDWDHDPVPFRDIWSEWLALEGIGEADIEVEAKMFSDMALRHRWQNFHQSRAEYRLAHKTCNLRKQ